MVTRFAHAAMDDLSGKIHHQISVYAIMIVVFGEHQQGVRGG